MLMQTHSRALIACDPGFTNLAYDSCLLVLQLQITKVKMCAAAQRLKRCPEASEAPRPQKGAAGAAAK